MMSRSRSPHSGSSASVTDSSFRLTGYLATGFGVATGMLATAPVEAAVVSIDIGASGFNIEGINAGLGYSSTTVPNFPFTSAGSLKLYGLCDSNNWGLAGDLGLEFAVTAATTASPRNFSAGSMIDSGALFQSAVDQSVFRYGYNTFITSPDFGPGSYMGFKTAQNNYGWLEVSWSSSLLDWEILSGAYETSPNTGIGIPVPEPVAVSLAGVAALAMGGAAVRRWRTARREQQGSGG